MADPFWLDPEAEDRLLEEAARRRTQLNSLVQSTDLPMAMQAADITSRNPNASPGLVEARLQGQVNDQQFDQLAAMDDGGFGSFVGRVADWVSDGADAVYEQAIKPLIRGTFTIADTIAQEAVQRPLTAGLVAAQDSEVGFGEAYEEYGDSAGRNILQGDVAPAEDGSLGTGFFAGGGAQARSEAERTLTIDGNQATLGRALPTSRIVGEMFGHDSTAYNAVSGVSQFAADVLTDPLALITGGGTTLARGAARAGMVQRGSRGYDLIQGGAMGVRRQARQLGRDEAAGILREADEAGQELVAATPRPVPADRSEAAEVLRREAGALEANGRRTVLIEKAGDFFGKREVLSEIAKADTYDLYQSFKRSAANNVDHNLIRRLGATTDEAEASEILLDAVQQGNVTEKGFYSGLSGFRRKVNDSKLAGTSARGRVSVDDIGDASDKLDSFMRQANVDRDTRASIYQRMVNIDAEDLPFEERDEVFFKAVEDAMGAVTKNLHGDTEAIVEATRLMRGDIKNLRMYGIDEAADVIPTPMHPSRVDPGTGEMVQTVGPQLTSELARVGFDLPDVTTIRRAAQRATRMQKLYTSKGWEMGSDTARWLTRDLFKPLAILRPAYVVRIGLEEQLRLTAAGYDSLFNHPARFIMANMLARTEEGATSNFARVLSKVSGTGDAKVNRTLGGDTFDEEAEAFHVMQRNAYNVSYDPTHARAREFAPISKPLSADEPGSARYFQAWQHELAQISAAREARWLAQNGGDLDGFVDWARNSADGQRSINRLARSTDEGAALLTDDEAVRELGQSIVVRLASKTGGEVRKIADNGTAWDYEVLRFGDEDLLNGVADGRLSGIRLSDQRDPAKTATANVRRFLRSKFDAAPRKLKMELEPDAAGAARRTGKLNDVIDGLFENLTGKPTTALARYPAFRQSYIKRAGELMDALATDDLRVAYSRQIDEAMTLTKAEKQDLAAAVARNMGKKGFHDELTELDEVVKLKAASEVKDLLFDVTKRSNIQDTYEVAAPFFDAWLEVTKTWGRLAKENPAFMLRAMQGYQSLRDSGIIYANDFGEEVFAMPGGGVLSQFFGNEDASLRLEGRVQGANLVAQGVGPGFGPMVQWGVGALMPDTREWQEIRDWMTPFGTGGVESAGDLASPGALAESFVPAWASKMFQAVSSGNLDPHQWNSTVGDTMKVLAESGNYQPGDPADRQRLIEDAKRGGRFVLALRGLVQGFALTGPSATWELNADVDESAIPEGWDPETDPDGKWHTLGTLGSELHRLAQFYDGDWSIATAKFIEMYGVEPHYITQAKTRSLTESPVTAEGDFWMREHDDFVQRHRAVAGYLVPPEEDVQMDYSVYRRQIETGDRESLTPEQQLALANQSKARSLYYAAQAQLDTHGIAGDQRTTALGQVRTMIEEQFPGWQDDVLGVGGTLTRDSKINRLFEAVMDPDAPTDTPLLQPLRIYLDARRQATEMAKARGYQSFNNQASADIRGKLGQVGQSLADQNPAFKGVWSQLLAGEVRE